MLDVPSTIVDLQNCDDEPAIGDSHRKQYRDQCRFVVLLNALTFFFSVTMLTDRTGHVILVRAW